MAGESPGKSEQQKSPGETTPGERDPRLAVFREPSAGASGSTKVAPANPAVDSEVVSGDDSGDGSEKTEASGGSGAGRITAQPESPESTESDTKSDAESDTANDTDAPSGTDEADSEAEAKVEAKAEVKADKNGKAGRTPSWAVAADSDAQDAKDAGDTEDADADRTGEKPSSDTSSDTAPDTSSDVASDVASEGSGRSRTAPAAPPADSSADDKSGKVTADGSGPAARKGASEGSEGPESGDRDRPQVDQPTAVFKALKRPSVDQPTTTLKVPPLPGEEKRESPAERTSTFVPLRRDDVRPGGTKPAASTSAPAAPAATAPLPEAERTRQQPMPPRPPLDLLAELTNTPPPRQTPVRTVVRRFKIWTPLVLILLVVFAVAQAVRPLPAPALQLSAEPTYTFEGGKLAMPWPSEGQGAVEVEGVGTIGMYGEQKPAPIASVAKAMTAYVILKEHPITGKQVGPAIQVDKRAGEESNRPDESTAPIKEGQEYTLKQMLQLLMIPSGNNAARLLARWDATSEKAFVEKMNAAAEDLGMTNTTYTDPSGLESSTVSTAADQLKLGKAVMQNDIFRDIVNTPQIQIPGVEPTIYNNNLILLEPGVSGIKTGSSTPAGGNLLWTADTIVDGKSRRIIGMVMGAQQADQLSEKLKLAIDNSLKLIQAAQEGVTSATVVKKGEVVGYVDDGLGGRTPVVATKELKAVGWAGFKVKLNIGEVAGGGEGGEQIPHSAEAGTVVGELTVGSGTGEVSAPVALQRDLAEPGFGAKLTRVS